MLTLGLDLGSVTTRCVALDERGGLVLTLCRRKDAGDAAALERFFDELEPLAVGRRLGLGAVWGRAAASRDRRVVEIGGHTAKFLVLGEDGGLRDFATNEACAAGTGSFLEQQARRLGLSAPELASLAAAAPRAATVAGRCWVFAASDMIHLQQKGTPPAEIAYGLCVAIARNDLSTLLKGRAAPPLVVMAGGCAHNRGPVRAFAEVLGLEGAVGAALAARAAEVPSVGPAEARDAVASLDRSGLLVNGAIALRRAVDVWRVRNVVGSRATRLEEPGYLEMRRLAGPYMPNEAHELLFVNVAKIVDFARGGADGVVNAICFGCMVGNASAAVIERIRRDFDDVPIVTAVYSGADDPSRRMVLDAFVAQVKAHARRRRTAAPASLGERLQRLAGWPR